MEWTWLKDWWRLKKWKKNRAVSEEDDICYCDECLTVNSRDIGISWLILQFDFLSFAGRPGLRRVGRRQRQWQEGGGGRVRDGQEVAVEAHEGDPDAAR